MISTGIDLTPYKMTSIGGQVGIGKSFIMGLFIDELLSINKNVCYINTEGSLMRFDRNNPNIRTFMFFMPDDIINFYNTLNSTGEEVYVCIDSIGAICFGNIHSSSSNIPRPIKIRAFLRKLKSYENIKTIFNFNYNKNYLSNSQLADSHRDYIESHIGDTDKFIDVEGVKNGKGEFDIHLNKKFLCKFDDLTIDPEIRAKRMKRESQISTIIN